MLNYVKWLEGKKVGKKKQKSPKVGVWKMFP